jgi:hypothetical protein
MEDLSLSEDKLVQLIYPIIQRDSYLRHYRDATALNNASIEELGSELAKVHMGRSSGLNYWLAVKREFRTFLCTDDKKYADLKKKISTSQTRSETAVTSLIAAAIASHLGLAAGALVPFCALLLIVLARMGRNAICAELPLDIPVVEPKKKKKK